MSAPTPEQEARVRELVADVVAKMADLAAVQVRFYAELAAAHLSEAEGDDA